MNGENVVVARVTQHRWLRVVPLYLLPHGRAKQTWFYFSPWAHSTPATRPAETSKHFEACGSSGVKSSPSRSHEVSSASSVCPYLPYTPRALRVRPSPRCSCISRAITSFASADSFDSIPPRGVIFHLFRSILLRWSIVINHKIFFIPTQFLFLLFVTYTFVSNTECQQERKHPRNFTKFIRCPTNPATAQTKTNKWPPDL